MSWAKRFGRVVLLLLLAELIFFFLLGTRIRKQLEGPREFLGSAAAETSVGLG